LVAALDYLGRGWSVLPIEPHAKRPLLPWRALQRQAASRAAVTHWFERSPDANIGIVTGQLSGLVVLDVDPYHGGTDSLAALEKRHGALPVTVEALTGGGGRHLYFRHPGPRLPNRVGLQPGLDVRGDGGCVVAPPSIHPSGRRYSWVRERAPGEAALAALPSWLVSLADSGRHGDTPRR
jgi:hypothetical protein